MNRRELSRFKVSSVCICLQTLPDYASAQRAARQVVFGVNVQPCFLKSTALQACFASASFLFLISAALSPLNHSLSNTQRASVKRPDHLER